MYRVMIVYCQNNNIKNVGSDIICPGQMNIYDEIFSGLDVIIVLACK